MTILIVLPIVSFLSIWLLFTYLLWREENRTFWFRDLMGITLVPSILIMALGSLIIKNIF